MRTSTNYETGGTVPAIEIEQEFAAAPERVFQRWTDADALARWFAPPGYSTVSASSDPRPGGLWRLDFRSGDGTHEYAERGAFREVSPYGRLALTLRQLDGTHANPETLVVVVLDDIGTPQEPRTRMHFRQSGYLSLPLRNANEKGWLGCFAGLGRDLGTGTGEEQDEGRPDPRDELEELFRDWFDASARKDLDAQMEPIAEDVVSYEHQAPQEYRGIEDVRSVCAAGLEYQSGDFRWDIPDLQIRVAGDLAVTWGLNLMQNTARDGTVRQDWSRGTRVFERRGGRWLMIHQHVSFPVDADGRAVMVR